MEIWNFEPHSKSGSSGEIATMTVGDLSIRVNGGSLGCIVDKQRRFLKIAVSFKNYFDGRLFELRVCDIEDHVDVFDQSGQHDYQDFKILIDRYKGAMADERKGIAEVFLNRALEFAVKYSGGQVHKLILASVSTAYRMGYREGKEEIQDGIKKLLDIRAGGHSDGYSDP